MGNTDFSSLRFWEGDEDADIAAATKALADSTKYKVIQSVTSAADRAARTTGTGGAIESGAYPTVFRTDVAALQTWDGENWRWISPVAAQQYAFGDSTTSGNVTSTTFQTYTTANFTFTPVRSGWANVYFELTGENMGGAFGWARARITMQRTGEASPTTLGEFRLMHSSLGAGVKVNKQWAGIAPVDLVNGENVTLRFLYQADVATTGWRILDFEWRVIQR